MTALDRARAWRDERLGMLVNDIDEDALAAEFEAHAKEAVREAVEACAEIAARTLPGVRGAYVADAIRCGIRAMKETP